MATRKPSVRVLVAATSVQLLILLLQLNHGQQAQAMGTSAYHRKIVHQNSGKCLDIAYDNNELILFNCTNDDSQYWAYNENGSGHLESKSIPGKCIAFEPTNAAKLGDCETGETSWNYENFSFKLRSNRFVCLDNYMDQNVDYNPLIAFDCWPRNKAALGAQRWILA